MAYLVTFHWGWLSASLLLGLGMGWIAVVQRGDGVSRTMMRWLAALAAALVNSKGLVAVGAVGVRKRGDTTAVTVDDQFHLGSDTKAMTATLIARMVEKGAGPSRSGFLSAFFTLVGMHGVHVTSGLIALVYLYWVALLFVFGGELNAGRLRTTARSWD